VASFNVAIHASNAKVLNTLPSVLSVPIDKGSRKIVYLVRHAEAEHNVHEKQAEEQARKLGAREEDVVAAGKRAINDDSFLDASLSLGGQHQVISAADKFSQLLETTHYPMPEIVFVSPLQRTLQTASLLFPNHPDMYAIECLREKRTGLPCDERRCVSELKSDFPHVDFADVEYKDSLSPAGYEFNKSLKEDNEALAERTLFLDAFLRDSYHQTVAVVTHKGFLRELNKSTLASAYDLEGNTLSSTFGNAEVRVCEFTWEDNGSLQVKARSLHQAMISPPMTLTPMCHDSEAPIRRSSALIGGGLHVAIGTSNAQDSKEAACSAWNMMQEKLGGAPTFALVFCHCGVDREAVSSTLQTAAGACFVVGGSSPQGVLTKCGLSQVSILGTRGLTNRCGIGAVADATGASARRAGAAAAREATQGQVPDIIVMWVAPGYEEDVLNGIYDVCGRVSIFGGTIGDASLTRFSEEAGWQLYGTMAHWGAHSQGVVVAALWLFQDSHATTFLSHCFSLTQNKGKITKASGRYLHEIDHQKAANVINDWMGGALHDRLTGGSIFRDAAFYPLAVGHKGDPRLVQMMSTTESGQIYCQSNVGCGDVRLLHLKATDFIGCMIAASKAAVEKAQFTVQGALITVTAAVPCVVEDFQLLVDSMHSVLPDWLCFFTLGEQGMLDETACHRNFCINLALFG